MARAYTASLRKQSYPWGKNDTYWGSRPLNYVRGPLILKHPEPMFYWQNGYVPMNRQRLRPPELNGTEWWWEGMNSSDFDASQQKWVALHAAGVERMYFNWRANSDPDYLGLDITVDWEDVTDAYTINNAGAGTVTRPTPTSTRVVWPNVAAQQSNLSAYVSLSAVGASGVSKPRIYRTADKAALDAGQFMTDEAIEFWSKGDAIRTYQQAQTNVNVITKASQLSLPDDYYAGVTMNVASWDEVPDLSVDSNVRYGMPYEWSIQQAIECGSMAYFQIEPLLGFPDLNSLPAGGDTAAAWRAYGNTDAAVTLADTTQIGAACTRVVEALNTVTDKDGNAYPVNRYYQVSLGNEMFNNDSPYHIQNNCYKGLGDYLGATVNREQFHAYGYQMAKLAYLMQQALVTGGRSAQKYMIMLEIFINITDYIDHVELGILDFESDFGVTIDRSVFYVSPSNYWRSFDYNNTRTLNLGTPYTNETEYWTAFAAAIDDAVLNSTEEDLYEEMYQEGLRSGITNNIKTIIANQADIYSRAVGHGMNVGFCYEGEDHDSFHDGSSELDLANEPDRRLFIANWFEHPKHGALHAHMMNLGWKHFSPSHPFYGQCNFFSFSPSEDHADEAQDSFYERLTYAEADDVTEQVFHGVAALNAQYRSVQIGGEH